MKTQTGRKRGDTIAGKLLIDTPRARRCGDSESNPSKVVGGEDVKAFSREFETTPESSENARGDRAFRRTKPPSGRNGRIQGDNTLKLKSTDLAAGELTQR